MKYIMLLLIMLTVGCQSITPPTKISIATDKSWASWQGWEEEL